MTIKRELIIQAAAELFEEQGYHATGLSQILEKSQTPKGSLYHYFPGGKEQLAVETVQNTGKNLANRIRLGLERESDPAIAIQRLITTIAGQIEQSGFKSGGPLTAIAMETATSNPNLNQACREAFQLIQEPIGDKLAASGIDPERAASLGTLIVSAIEGGTLLCRTQHSGDPLRDVADQMLNILQRSLEEKLHD